MFFDRKCGDRLSAQEPAPQEPAPAEVASVVTAMTASEQMFFLGSPLAHVVRYEDELRTERLERIANARQARRILADL